MKLEEEVARRRTFAIISHPDAGKTTLTEKILLYAKAIHLAGSVKSRRSTRATVSDWMTIEQERGISVTSSVLQFDYRGNALNLVDTPGHADFSEDTFRTLAAVDSALMLMDHSKGVEPRTRRLFEVCRMRKLPVVTFMNKLDRFGLDPLELIDQVSQTLNLRVAPLNWPIGMGTDFRGVVNCATRELILYETAQRHGSEIIESRRADWDDAESLLSPADYARISEELELITEAGDIFRLDAYLSGEVSPLFWGSAMSNFGIEELLGFVADKAASPTARETESGETIEPDDERFAGFVFKIQANMNPRHRDGIAFMRVASGQFQRGMDVLIGRTGETLRLAKPHSFLAQERSLVDEAWPGDIVGLYNTGKLRVGDTLAEGRVLKFTGIPRFAPEHFVQVQLEDPLKRKQLDSGLEQLSQEGVVQLFTIPGRGSANPYLGAVGLLQFEVLKQRLKNEYKVSVRFQTAGFNRARWLRGPDSAVDWLRDTHGYLVVHDRNHQQVVLADSEWALDYALENTADLELFDVEPL